MRKKKDKKRVDTDIREQVREIMRDRRELRRARKEAIKNGNWEDIIPMLVVEEDSDVSSYREQMESAGMTIYHDEQCAGYDVFRTGKKLSADIQFICRTV